MMWIPPHQVGHATQRYFEMPKPVKRGSAYLLQETVSFQIDI